MPSRIEQLHTELRNEYMERSRQVAGGGPVTINEQNIVIEWDRSGLANDGIAYKLICESLGMPHANIVKDFYEQPELQQLWLDREQEWVLGTAQARFDDWLTSKLTPPQPLVCPICKSSIRKAEGYFFGVHTACAKYAVSQMIKEIEN